MRPFHILAVVVVVPCLLIGCASMGGAEKRKEADKTGVTDVLTVWKTAIEAKDIEKLMALYSDYYRDFSSGDKAGVRAFMGKAMEDGMLDSASVNLEHLFIEIEGDTAIAYPVELNGSFGLISQEFTLLKEEGGWKIIEVQSY